MTTSCLAALAVRWATGESAAPGALLRALLFCEVDVGSERCTPRKAVEACRAFVLRFGELPKSKAEGDPAAVSRVEVAVAYAASVGSMEACDAVLQASLGFDWVEVWMLKQKSVDYKNPLEEYFYRGIKREFLDYYTVLSELGYSDSEAESLVSGKLKTVYERAKEVMRVKSRGAILKKGIMEQDKSALSMFLKDSETSKERGEIYSPAPTENSHKSTEVNIRIDRIEIDKSKDDVLYSLGGGGARTVEKDWLDIGL